MLFNYFSKKPVLRDTFGEILSIQIPVYPQTSVEKKLSAFYLKNKVSEYKITGII